MVEQYPDSIAITVKAPVTSQGPSGEWVDSSSQTTYTINCRREENTGGRKIMTQDGVLTDYAYCCYMPKQTVSFPDGSAYALNGEEITGNIKHASNGQLNTRVWL